MPIKMILSGANPSFPCEVMGNTPVEVWKSAADMSSLVNVKACGACDSKDIRPDVRHVKTDSTEFDAYGWRCYACGATLKFGMKRDMSSLFLRWNEEWFKPEKKAETPPI